MNKFFQYSMIMIAIVLVFMPMLLLLFLSFGKGYGYPNLLPDAISLESYRYLLLEHPKLMEITIRSLLISFMVASLSVVLGLMAGRAIGGPSFKGQWWIKRIALLPLLVPMISIAMGLHIVFIKLHLANRLLGVVLIQTVMALPYSVLIFGDLFLLIGEKWFEQGLLYGAIGLKRFRYVTFPLISDGIVSAFSICFIVSFSQYFVTLLMGGGRIKTFATEMFPFINSGNFMLASSFSVVFLMINLVMLGVVEIFVKSFVRKGYREYKES